MKCPVCCENFSGERCPHCGMRVSSDQESRLFAAEPSAPVQKGPARPVQTAPARPVQTAPVRPVQKGPARPVQTAPVRPVQRRGKVSLAALERRQEAQRRTRRALRWAVGIFLVAVAFGMISAFWSGLSEARTPEEPVSADEYDSPYADLEWEMEDWAAQEGWDTLFFYMEENESMNGSLHLADVQMLAEQASVGDEEALARWQDAEAACGDFYEQTRAHMDEIGRSRMPLVVWLADSESGELVLAMDQDGLWYSYYEDLVTQHAA